jgi:hypothetical protein
MKHELEDIILKGLAKDLYQAERSIFLYRRIIKYAEPINGSTQSIKDLFRLIQLLTFRDAIMSVARIYDFPQNRYPNRCIFRLLKILEEAGNNALPITESYQTIEQLHYLRMPPMLVDLVRENDHIKFTNYLSKFLLTETYQPEFRNTLEELKRVRDKILAHNEPTTLDHSIQFKNLDLLIDFVKKVIGIVSWAFLSTAYMIKGKHQLSDDAERYSFLIDRFLNDCKIINEA